MGIDINNATVNPAIGALPTLLYGPNGSPLPLTDRALAPLAQAGLPTGVINDGIVRLSRGDVTGGRALARFVPLMVDQVDQATNNPSLWTEASVTYTIAQSTKQVVFNSGASLAAAASAIRTSVGFYGRALGSVLRRTSRCRFEWYANSQMEWGFGAPTTNTQQLVNGIFLRINATGDVTVRAVYNSTDGPISGTLCTMGAAAGQLDPTSWYTIDLWLADDSVRIVIQRSNDTLVGLAEAPIVDYTMRFAIAQIAEYQAIALPAFWRVYSTSAPTFAPRIWYSADAIMVYDQDLNQPYKEILAASMRSAWLNPASGAQLANWANIAAPTTATLSNSAAGYATLGGQFQFAAPLGAETDYALFGFQVPTGRQLLVRGVIVDVWNTVVPVATTPTLMQWGIGRASAVSLATANAIRKVIGSCAFAVGAAVGQQGDRRIEWDDDEGLVVESGQFFHIIVKVPIGTATATEIFRGWAGVRGTLR